MTAIASFPITTQDERWAAINTIATDAIMFCLFGAGIASIVEVFAPFGAGWPFLILVVPLSLAAILVAVRVAIDALVDHEPALPTLLRLASGWRWAFAPVAVIGLFTAVVTPWVFVLIPAVVAVAVSRRLRTRTSL